MRYNRAQHDYEIFCHKDDGVKKDDEPKRGTTVHSTTVNFLLQKRSRHKNEEPQRSTPVQGNMMSYSSIETMSPRWGQVGTMPSQRQGTSSIGQTS